MSTNEKQHNYQSISNIILITINHEWIKTQTMNINNWQHNNITSNQDNPEHNINT